MVAIKQHLQADREKLTKIRALLVRAVCVGGGGRGAVYFDDVIILSSRLVRIVR